MQEIKKINVLSVLKVSALFGVLMGIIVGIYMALIFPSIIVANPTLAEAGVSSSATMGAILVGAIVQAVMVIVMATLGVLLYNLFASWVGGIKVECLDAHTKRRK